MDVLLANVCDWLKLLSIW